MLFLVCFDQGHQDFGILLFFARWIIFACQFVQDGQVLLMPALGGDWCWLCRFELLTSIPAVCVPPWCEGVMREANRPRRA